MPAIELSTPEDMVVRFTERVMQPVDEATDEPMARRRGPQFEGQDDVGNLQVVNRDTRGLAYDSGRLAKCRDAVGGEAADTEVVNTKPDLDGSTKIEAVPHP